MSTAQRSPLRSIITRASVFLLLGAIVNVAVAWGCVFLAPIHRSNDLTDSIAVLVRNRMHDGTNQAWSLDWQSGTGVCGTELLVRWLPDEHADVGAIDQCFAGWPCVAVYGECNSESQRQNQVTRTQLVTAIGTGRSSRFDHEGEEFLPVAPVWPGFAINTLFYAAILWGLFAAPFALRRHRRIKRGLCPKCAYDLRGCASQNCPECGKPVKPEAGVR